MGKLIGICISKKKGTAKEVIPKVNLIEKFGLENDAHGGDWHRQVSLLSVEKINDFNAKGANVNYGAFGENLIVEGFDLKTIPIGTKIKVGDAILEVTQIGKECHTKCAIYYSVGECIMPKEGIFAIVIKGAEIKEGDVVDVD